MASSMESCSPRRSLMKSSLIRIAARSTSESANMQLQSFRHQLLQGVKELSQGSMRQPKSCLGKVKSRLMHLQQDLEGFCASPGMLARVLSTHASIYLLSVCSEGKFALCGKDTPPVVNPRVSLCASKHTRELPFAAGLSSAVCLLSTPSAACVSMCDTQVGDLVFPLTPCKLSTTHPGRGVEVSLLQDQIFDMQLRRLLPCCLYWR